MDRSSSKSPTSEESVSGDHVQGGDDDVIRLDPTENDEYVSLVDLVLIVLDRRRLVIWTTMIVTLLGMVYSLLATESYTSNATVIREAAGETPSLGSIGGLSALQGLGLNLGPQSGRLTPSAYPTVIKSREVRLAVARDTFFFPDLDQAMTLVEYSNQPPGISGRFLKYTVKLPWTIKEALVESMPDQAMQKKPAEQRRLTEREYNALQQVDEMMQTSVDDGTGLMTITVSAEHPQVASDVVDRFVVHLRERVRTLRTAKAREQLAFLDDRFHEVEAELDQAEDSLARFLQRNQNPTTATLRFERDRLQRQVSFKEQLYSQIQGQVAQTRLDLQRQQPVVTVVETPVTPIERTRPARTLIVILSMIFGFSLGAGLAISSHFLSQNVSNEECAHFERILHDIVPESVWQRIGYGDASPNRSS